VCAAPVVIFRSTLTDLGPVPRLLARRGIAWREEVMGMGSAAERERFRALKAATGWPTLPQIFVDGELLGGIEAALERFGRGSGGVGL